MDCPNTFWQVWRLQEFLTHSCPSLQKFSFCTVKIESVEWLNLVHRSSIDDCDWIHFLCWGLLCSPAIKSLNFSARRAFFTNFPSALRPYHLGSLADFAITVSKEESTKTVLTWCHFNMTFGLESWEIWAGAGTSAISRFSAKSRQPFGNTILLQFPEAPSPQFSVVHSLLRLFAWSRRDRSFGS